MSVTKDGKKLCNLGVSVFVSLWVSNLEKEQEGNL